MMSWPLWFSLTNAIPHIEEKAQRDGVVGFEQRFVGLFVATSISGTDVRR